MKKLFFILILFCAHFTSAQMEWHVKPFANNASTVGDGLSFETAWSLQNALNNPNGVINPGDVVWLHGGTYNGLHYESHLNGTATKYIKVASYPGEWAILNGNIYPYVTPVAPPPGAILKAEDETNFEIELETRTSLDTEESDPAVLVATGGYVSFENFEISCLGNLNRLLISDVNKVNCEPTNGYHTMVGIRHRSATKNRFANLVIRNIPGSGIGSWKETMDSEIYGCLIYNNGYILNQKETCGTTEYNVLGKGFGIYTQNNDGAPNRVIKNNIFHNNYDSGIAIWSATKDPVGNYLNNYTVSNNIFINNGGPERDETPNIKVMSASTNSYNHPSNINIDRNLFYINSRSSYLSGLVVQNSNGVTITNNHIFKGTAGFSFTSNNYNLNYHNNFYWGKFNQYYILPSDYTSHNWSFGNNKHYCWNTVHPQVCQILNPNHNPNVATHPVTNPLTLRITLSNFQSPLTTLNGYNGESGTVGPPANAPYGQYIIYGENGVSPPDVLHFATGASGPHLFSKKTFVTQNAYNPNVFYVVAFDPNSLLNNNITVDFSSYGIPAGSNYKIKDAEDFFGPVISGNLTGNTITFAMNNILGFESPIGVLGIDYTSQPVHSAKDLHTYVVEFGCDNIPYDRVLTNTTISGSANYDAKKNITLGTSFIMSNTGASNIKAGKQILIKANSHIRAGASFFAKIENPCPDLTYVGESVSGKQTNDLSDNEMPKQKENQQFTIYPNPNSGFFNIESKTGEKITKVVISRIDNAKQVFSQSYSDTNDISIDISKQTPGLYTVEVFFGNQSHSKTIIKN